MYIQSPSVLAYQRSLQNRSKRNNLQSQFNVESIPSDNVMRSTLDVVPSDELSPVFKKYLSIMPKIYGKTVLYLQLLCLSKFQFM